MHHHGPLQRQQLDPVTGLPAPCCIHMHIYFTRISWVLCWCILCYTSRHRQDVKTKVVITTNPLNLDSNTANLNNSHGTGPKITTATLHSNGEAQYVPDSTPLGPLCTDLRAGSDSLRGCEWKGLRCAMTGIVHAHQPQYTLQENRYQKPWTNVKGQPSHRMCLRQQT